MDLYQLYPNWFLLAATQGWGRTSKLISLKKTKVYKKKCRSDYTQQIALNAPQESFLAFWTQILTYTHRQLGWFVPGTPNNHFLLDVWWNNHFLCKELESSNWTLINGCLGFQVVFILDLFFFASGQRLDLLKVIFPILFRSNTSSPAMSSHG